MPRNRGFTLIEVMVTVAIVAILASIALPNYSEYIRRGRLTEVFSTLSGQRVKMEQFFQDNRVYTGACAAGTVAPPPVSQSFTYACVFPTPGQYTITATGNAGGTMAGFVYTLTETNARDTTGLPAGWVGVNSGCWVNKKDGSC